MSEKSCPLSKHATSGLYLNVNAHDLIDYVIEMANEHMVKLDLFGLALTDIHIFLLYVVTNSYFRYNGTLWKNMDGLFIRLRPGRLLAVIRVDKRLRTIRST